MPAKSYMYLDVPSWLQDVENVPAGPPELPLLSCRGKRKYSRPFPTRDVVHPTPPPESPTSPGGGREGSSFEMPSSKKRKTGPGAPTMLPSARDGRGEKDNDTINDNEEYDDNSDDDNGGDKIVGNDHEQTPRPPLRRRRPIPSDASSLSYVTRSSKSGLSGASSPRKHLAAMALSDSGVQFRKMTDPSLLPPTLAATRAKLVQYTRGRGIFGTSVKDSLLAGSLLHPDLQVLQSDPEFYLSSSRDDLGSTPSPEDVLYLFECDGECSRLDCSEFAWNNEVHFPLLSLALRPRIIGSVFKRLIKVATCSTASIIQEYRTLHAPQKKIDFCVYIDAQYDPDSTETASYIDIVRTRLPFISINPTDDLSLLCHPIAIPIETKRPGEGLDTANLQLSTWLSSHFVFLQRLVDLGSLLPPDGEQPVPSLDDIEFLPGLIVQGSSWKFIAATREGSRTVIWFGSTIGSTDDVFGIFQIVTALQMLRMWVNTTYWPWLRRVIQRAATATEHGRLQSV
ncbi:hypothetical protein AK830_g3352 [Neonectria ditissima]|uniref:PD-(D/E)XK nuclease-like domain-containing protein n=1 Tax=Neonectria ditissima TaxID=78410 RepID=A0A0P7BPC1_9HYPO|nr:hypothetical protein AK830_g3352 [Neonectria ditissima]